MKLQSTETNWMTLIRLKNVFKTRICRSCLRHVTPSVEMIWPTLFNGKRAQKDHTNASQVFIEPEINTVRHMRCVQYLEMHPLLSDMQLETNSKDLEQCFTTYLVKSIDSRIPGTISEWKLDMVLAQSRSHTFVLCCKTLLCVHAILSNLVLLISTHRTIVFACMYLIY